MVDICDIQYIMISSTYTVLIYDVMITSCTCSVRTSLEGKDLQHMNQLAKADWKKTVAIALLKPLKTPFYQLLRSFIPSATLVVG